MAVKPDYKKHGFIPQRQSGQLIMRIRNRGGNMTATQLRELAGLAECYGNGQVHVTTRQAVEIPGVAEEKFAEALQATLQAGLLPAVCGPRVRPVVACPGTDTCPFGLMESRALGEILDDTFVGRDMPAKTKIAVSSCANSCTKPQANDIGCKGAVEPVVNQAACISCGACVRRCPAQAMQLIEEGLHIKEETCLGCGVCVRICPKKALSVGQSGYHVYVGGKGGRYSYDGQLLARFVPAESIVAYLEAVLAVYQEKAAKGERLFAVLAEQGLASFQAAVTAKFDG